MSKKPVTLWKTALESDELSCPVEGDTEGYRVVPVFCDESRITNGGVPCGVCCKEGVLKFVWLVLPECLGKDEYLAEAFCLECFAKSLAIVEE